MKRVAIGLGIVVLALLCARLWFFPYEDLRYRLSLTVNLDGKEYSGSSVRQVRYTFGTFHPINVMADTPAQALVIKLPDDAVLVAMLVPRPDGQAGAYKPSPASMPVKEFGMAPSIGALKQSSVRRVRLEGARVAIPLDRLPLLVYLPNANDPDTASIVDPKNPAATLGDHAMIVRADIETVDMGFWPLRFLVDMGPKVSTNIEDTIPWARDYQSLHRFSEALLRDGWKPGSSIGLETLFTQEY